MAKKTKKTKKSEKTYEKTLVVNLFGGPSTGKSSVMAGVFAYLKFKGVDCEIAPEFAKDKVWEESYRVLKNQIYIFGKQHHRIFRLIGKVNLIITDSPLLLSLYYGGGVNTAFDNLVLCEHNKMFTKNIFLRRRKKYNPNGRLQTKKQAIQIDRALKDILIAYAPSFIEEDATYENIASIGEKCIETLNELNKMEL